MSTYTKITDFAAKDALLTGNPSKIVKGTEIGAEFDSIASADASNVKGPSSAVTDNAVVRWDTTTGRLAQGSGVTISDSDVVTASGFSGPHNGTVGATTPAAGAFTTLSATSSVTSNDGTNGTVQIGTTNYKIQGGASYAGLRYQVPTANTHDFQVNGVLVGQVSSTGLAVTGALSATNGSGYGTVTLNGTSGGYVALQYGGVEKGALYANNSACDMTTAAGLSNNWYIGGSLKMTLDSSGRLLVPNGTVVAPVAFASLPASPVAGQRAMINNSVAAPAFLSTAAGGGSTTVPVFYNGTTWLVG